MAYRVYGLVRDGSSAGVADVDVELWEDVDPPWDTPRAVVKTAFNGVFTAFVNESSLTGAPPKIYFRVVQRGTELANTFEDLDWDPEKPDDFVIIEVTPLPDAGECCPRYLIRGLLQAQPVGAGSPQGLPGWTVELWEDGADWELPRATTLTAADGAFRAEIDASKFATATRQIRFRVANNGTFVSPDPSETWTPADLDAVITISITMDPVRAHVEGFVRNRDGTPLEDYTVKAFASLLRTEDEVGTATTNADGHYALDCVTDETKFDLILRAFDDEATPVEVAHSALFPDAAKLLYVDFVVGNLALAGKAEYTKMIEAIDGARESVAYADLTDDDLAQIAAKYLVPVARLQLAVDAQLASDPPTTSAELFYAIGSRAGRVTVSSALSLSAADRQAAVDEAITRNLVSSAFAANAASELAALAAMQTSLTLTDPALTLPTRLAMIMRVGGLTNATDRETLLDEYTGFDGTPEEFWAAAPGLTGISSGALDDVRAALHIGIYTLNHPPMVQSLWNSSIRTAKALGSLSTSDWATRIAATVTLPGGSSVTVGFPNEIVGADDTAKAANYAAALTTVNTRAFPSNALRTAYTASPISSTSALSTFLSAHTDFDFAQQSIYAYVRANPTAFTGNPDGLPQVEKLARLFKISPEVTRYATAKKLWDAGFDSARSVYLFGKEPFIAKMTASPYSLSADTATQIFSKSAHITGVTSSIAFTYGQSFQGQGEGGAITIMSASTETLTEVPDWNTLFDSLDYCACDECASVHGPAAYLTDLLHFLEQRQSTSPPTTALEVLQARRPDLTKTELACINTNTVVPYIDLLHERLELRVSPDSGADYQTTWTAAELALHPEHLRAEAYDLLLTKVYPWTMPYNLWLDESRWYVRLKSVTRAEVRAAVLVDPRFDDAWVSERLGLDALERQSIEGSGAFLPNEYWGMATGSPWFSTLDQLPNVLAQSGLTYDELAAEIATTFVSTAQSPAVEIDLHDKCSIETATLTNITSGSSAFFDRLHRFDRLRRALGWTVRQTDRAIQHLGDGVLDDALTPELATGVEVLRRTKSKVDDILTWQSGALIDTAPDPTTGISPFERMFPRRNVATGDETFALSPDRTQLAVELASPPDLVDELTAIASGMGTTVDALTAIVDELSLETEPSRSPTCRRSSGTSRSRRRRGFPCRISSR